MKTEYTPKLMPAAGPGDHSRGSASAAVVLVEYGDFQCPYCGAAYPMLKELEARAGELLRVVFRNFPLATIHPDAERAAEAAEAAGAQGKFWEMHDMLYENQRRLGRTALGEYAEQIGLDMARFAKELDQREWRGKVNDHFRSGVLSGVNGTPSFFVNGRRHDGDYTLEALFAAVEAAAGQ